MVVRRRPDLHQPQVEQRFTSLLAYIVDDIRTSPSTSTAPGEVPHIPSHLYRRW